MHCLTKCPDLKQFMQMLCSFKTDTMRSCVRLLNLAQAYSVCFSVLQVTHKVAPGSEVLAANDVISLPGAEFFFENCRSLLDCF